jgi:hypothetical protein
MPELIKQNRCAFIIAYALAYRARWNDDAFNPFRLKMGEAVCDYENWGLSEGEWRSGRSFLERHGYATFHTTNVGRRRVTVGRLVNTRLFSVLDGDKRELFNESRNGGQTNDATSHATDGATTYIEQRAENVEQRTEYNPPGEPSQAPAVFVPKFREFWSQEYKKKFRRKYFFTDGDEAAIASLSARNIPAHKIVAVAQGAWDNGVADKASTVASFAEHFDEIHKAVNQ